MIRGTGFSQWLKSHRVNRALTVWVNPDTRFNTGLTPGVGAKRVPSARHALRSPRHYWTGALTVVRGPNPVAGDPSRSTIGRGHPLDGATNEGRAPVSHIDVWKIRGGRKTEKEKYRGNPRAVESSEKKNEALMGKWIFEREPEMVPVAIDPMQFQENIAEVARLLYHHFCQLDPKSKSVSIPRPELQAPVRKPEVRR